MAHHQSCEGGIEYLSINYVGRKGYGMSFEMKKSWIEERKGMERRFGVRVVSNLE